MIIGQTDEGKQTERDVIDCIRRYIASHGYAPTIREIAGEVGKSYSTTRWYLNNLHDKGILESEDWGSTRAMRLNLPVPRIYIRGV